MDVESNTNTAENLSQHHPSSEEYKEHQGRNTGGRLQGSDREHALTPKKPSEMLGMSIADSDTSRSVAVVSSFSETDRP